MAASGATDDPTLFRRPAPPSVEQLVKEVIIHRGYQPGDKLPTELEFAAELGVSRNAVREAMRSLQALGILEIRHGHGLFLSAASLPRVADGLEFWGRVLTEDTSVVQRVAEIRDRLESSLVVDVVGRLGDDDIAEMREALAEMAEATSRGERALDADRRFHEVLYRPLDNWVLISLLRALWDAMRGVAATTEPAFPLTDIIDHHQRILDAVVAEDRDAAAAAMHAHFTPLLRGTATPEA